MTACCRRSSCLARNAARSAAGVCSTNQFFFSRVILRVRVGRAHFGLTESSSSLVSSPSVGWFFVGGRSFYGITCSFRFWEVAGPRAQLQLRGIKEEGVQTMCIFFLARAVKISDICGEMNPLVFSALEEVNLVFTLMVSSTVMVDIVFARFMFCTFYWR